MIKSWPLNEKSDSSDYFTYAWLEITRIRAEIDKIEGLAHRTIKINNSNNRQNLEEEIMSCSDTLETLRKHIDCLDDLRKEFGKNIIDSEYGEMFDRHRWVEMKRITNLNRLFLDVADGSYVPAPTSKIGRNVLH